ncbi:hypothetical protein PG990_007597 [Apiospora arundinis]
MSAASMYWSNEEHTEHAGELVGYETFDFLPDYDFDAESFLEGLQDIKRDLQLSTIGFHQKTKDPTRTDVTSSTSPYSECMDNSQSSANASCGDSLHSYRCDSQAETGPSTAEPLPHGSIQSPQPPAAVIEHEATVTCQHCSRLFAPQSLRRHLVSKHSFTCEKGCKNLALETRRDLERHYKTSMHRNPDTSGGITRTSAAGYECACGKPDFRKDLHKRHLKKCKKAGRDLSK